MTGSRTPAWRLFAIEASLMAMLMVAIGCGLILLEHPSSGAHRAIASGTVRRGLMGLLMGTTVAGLIASPWGKRSGAHFNPAVTLAHCLLGNISPPRATGYVVAQLVGACAGMAALFGVAGDLLAHPNVGFAATKVGPWGTGWAFVAEFGLSFVMMGVILSCSARPRLQPFVPLAAGGMIAMFVLLETPVSGMSINPARTLGSAVVGGGLDRFWLYCLAPVGGALAAASLQRLRPPNR